ncbi:MAG: Ig-like domain-containing protein [Pirellulaceae bacterium]
MTFSPAANFAGTTTAVTYQVADNDGATTSANILISVNEVNDSPSATNDSPTTNEDTPVTFNPLANDTDVDGTLDGSTVIFINPPAGATLSPNGRPFPAKEFYCAAADRRNHVQPSRKFFRYDDGSDVPSSGQRRGDNFCQYFDCSSEVNDAPTATNDSPTTNERYSVTFNPLANDTDVDGTLDGWTVIFINPPAGATLSPNGKTLTVPGEGVYTVL